MIKTNIRKDRLVCLNKKLLEKEKYILNLDQWYGDDIVVFFILNQIRDLQRVWNILFHLGKWDNERVSSIMHWGSSLNSFEINLIYACKDCVSMKNEMVYLFQSAFLPVLYSLKTKSWQANSWQINNYCSHMTQRTQLMLCNPHVISSLKFKPEKRFQRYSPFQLIFL